MSAYDPENDDPADSPTYSTQNPTPLQIIDKKGQLPRRGELSKRDVAARWLKKNAPAEKISKPTSQTANQRLMGQEAETAALKKWKQGNQEVNKMLAKMRQNR